MSTYLSKSDFQLASSCAKKLVYKKAYFPTSNDTNEYMKMLAEGGYIVGKMATLLYPEGIEIEGNTADCIKETQAMMARENVTLFEAAITAGKKLVRVDILVKKGKHIDIIEVKSGSCDTDQEQQKKTLDKYLQDVAYQFAVVKEAYPGHSVSCFLLMPDKAKSTEIEGLAGWFEIKKQEKTNDNELEELPAQQKPAFQKPEVVLKDVGENEKADFIARLESEGILSLLDVTKEAEAAEGIILQRAAHLLRILENGIAPDDFRLKKACKSCEFKSEDKSKSGYHLCWGALADPDPHIFDLYYGGSIGHHTKTFYLDELIEQNRTALSDIDPERLKNTKGELSKRGERQVMQIQHTIEPREWKSDQLESLLRGLTYPLHFIDFETYLGALPFHRGMRAYELIAFQWSCHTITHPNATPIHSEWIHTGSMFPDPGQFPNFAFARALRNQIGLTGTPLMWASHENTVLRTILRQMDAFGEHDDALRNWLTAMTSDKQEKREGRFVDMNKITGEHYFHPAMKGRTSIKKVLPAIWTHFPALHQVPHFSTYAPDTFIGGIVDPYDTLAAAKGDEDEELGPVSGGTDAMRAYFRIRFDRSLSEQQREELRRKLLEYCKLDTMAMVIIARHWGLS